MYFLPDFEWVYFVKHCIARNIEYIERTHHAGVCQLLQTVTKGIARENEKTTDLSGIARSPGYSEGV